MGEEVQKGEVAHGPRRGPPVWRTLLVGLVLLVGGGAAGHVAVGSALRVIEPAESSEEREAPAANRTLLEALGIDPDDTRGPVDPVAEREGVDAVLTSPPPGLSAAVALTCTSLQTVPPSAFAVGPRTLVAALPRDTIAVAVRFGDAWHTARVNGVTATGLVLLDVDATVAVFDIPDGVAPLRRGQILAVRDAHGHRGAAVVTGSRTDGTYDVAVEGSPGPGALVSDPSGAPVGLLATPTGRTVVVPIRGMPTATGPAAAPADCAGPGRGPSTGAAIRIAPGIEADVRTDVLAGRLQAVVAGLNLRAPASLGDLPRDEAARQRIVDALGSSFLWDIEVTAIAPVASPGGDPTLVAREVSLRYQELDAEGCWTTDDRLVVLFPSSLDDMVVRAWEPDLRTRQPC